MGRLKIGTDHLDFERLLRIAARPEKMFSSGAVLGHVHLNVGDLDGSQAFYESVGLDLMAEAGNVMLHELGPLSPSPRLNLLEGHGAAAVEKDVRGLQSFDVRRIAEHATTLTGAG